MLEQYYSTLYVYISVLRVMFIMLSIFLIEQVAQQFFLNYPMPVLMIYYSVVLTLDWLVKPESEGQTSPVL